MSDWFYFAKIFGYILQVLNTPINVMGFSITLEIILRWTMLVSLGLMMIKIIINN